MLGVFADNGQWFEALFSLSRPRSVCPPPRQALAIAFGVSMFSLSQSDGPKDGKETDTKVWFAFFYYYYFFCAFLQNNCCAR